MKLEKIFKEAKDFLPLLGTDYIEFYVGNAKQSAHFFKTAFGFQSYAYKGLETNNKEYVSYVLTQDKIKNFNNLSNLKTIEITNPFMITEEYNSDDGTIHEPLNEKDFEF